MNVTGVVDLKRDVIPYHSARAMNKACLCS